MIHYALRCGGGHEFDGWFKDSVSFDAQAASGLLDCPICANTSVERALMAPRVNTRKAVGPVEPAPVKPPETADNTHAVVQTMPASLRAALQRVREEVETRCDYVGADFAAQARLIHDGTEKPRPIYGEATPEEAAALAEDGIDVARIPWVPRADS